MMADEMDLKPLWDKVADQVKQKVIHPTLWRSLELAVPVITDGDQFVIGFPATQYHMSGNLTTAQHRTAIEGALREFTGRSYRIRVMDGTTLQDWQSVLDREKSALDQHLAQQAKLDAELAVTHSWDGLYEQASRMYASTPARQFPQVRAIYIEKMIAEISDAIDELMDPAKPNDLAERSLARIIDRVGTLTETPGAVIGMELRKYRTARNLP